MAIYLGLDCSTQSMTVVAVEVADGVARSVFEHAVVFDRDLPAYGTRHGVLRTSDPLEAVSPPTMWAEALELALAACRANGLDVDAIAAVSGSAQQHGSVYLNAGAPGRLGRLDADVPLAPQVTALLARPVSPIWMDDSTTVECREITRAFGGAEALAQATGSRAFERFTGPQVRRFWKVDPAAWEATARVHLVSSFMASLLIGADAPLEPGDASGMNLMDLATAAWLPAALDATAPGLADRLPAIVPSASVVGRIAPYWQRRHGLPPARVVAWTGDNPSSLVGTGLVREGLAGVSLGTSDTLFGLMDEPRVDPAGTGHVFGAPTGTFMGLTVYRNGSLARERVRDDRQVDWAGFEAALQATAPGNGGALLLPWFEPEITPDVRVPGLAHRDLAAADGPAWIRAVVEGQMMAMANHAAWMGVDIDVIHATGGAANNRAILQVMADVFDADVCRFETTNAAALGASLRAWHADARASGTPIPWPDIVRGVAEPVAASRVTPVPASVAVYREARRRYAEFEDAERRRRLKSA